MVPIPGLLLPSKNCDSPINSSCLRNLFRITLQTIRDLFRLMVSLPLLVVGKYRKL